MTFDAYLLALLLEPLKLLRPQVTDLILVFTLLAWAWWRGEAVAISSVGILFSAAADRPLATDPTEPRAGVSAADRISPRPGVSRGAWRGVGFVVLTYAVIAALAWAYATVGGGL